MRKFLLCTAVGLGVGCGATSIGPGSLPSPTGTPTPGQRFDVTATETDHSISMQTGQTLEVILRAASGVNSWTHPVSNDSSTLSPIVDPAATAARGVTLAAFRAA